MHPEGFPPEPPICRMDCTQGCSQHFTQPGAFPAAHTTEELGVHSKLGGGRAGTGDPAEPRDIAHHGMPSCPAPHPAWGAGKEAGTGMFRGMGVCLPKSLLWVLEPCFPARAEHPPAQGTWWVDSWFCFACGLEAQQPQTFCYSPLVRQTVTGRKQFNFSLADRSLNSYELFLQIAPTDVSAGNTTDTLERLTYRIILGFWLGLHAEAGFTIS